MPDTYKDSQVEKEALTHRTIKLSSLNNFKLFIIYYFHSLCNIPFRFMSCCLNKKVLKLYEVGVEQIDAEMDISRITKYIRDIRIYMKQKVLDDHIKFQIQHNHKNVINLDHAKTQPVLEFGESVQ